MSYQVDKKTGDIIISGFESGIATSPHKGIANIQGGNIATESGEVLASFARINQINSIAGGGTMTGIGSGTLSVSATTGTFTSGIWISVTGMSGISSGDYFVLYYSSGQAYIQSSYNGTSYVGGTVQVGTGTMNYTVLTTPSAAIAQQTESYFDSNNVQQYRYYILDSQGYLWVNDTAGFGGYGATGWFCPCYYGLGGSNFEGGGGSVPATSVTGLGLLNGWIGIVAGNYIFWKSTSKLGAIPSSNGWISLMTGFNSNIPHFCYIGHQGKMYYTDGNYIGSIFPNTSLINTTQPNIQSYCTYTSTSTTGTLKVIGGSIPSTGGLTPARVPAVFFAGEGSGYALATALLPYADKYVWIQYGYSGQTFQVYTASSAGSLLDITTGAVGTQYFNTFYPVGVTGAGSGTDLYTFTPQRVNLPFFETAISILEIGNQVIFGCKGNVIYPWGQVNPTPDGIINLPENNVSSMIAANNMGYIFAGYKGNIYITNGSTISPVISVPDYCAGVPGTPKSYIEPYFTWGGTNYIRGRIYFSILDQTAAKAGNCGGIWSFVPSNNAFIQQDTGLALRLENQNSYGTYNGYALQIIPATQNAIAPQYFSAWQSAYNGGTYGIDATGTNPVSSVVIETDLIPTGDFFNKETYGKVQYKVASPLINGDAISMEYRLNSTDNWASLGTVNTETVQTLSGAWTGLNFQESQWIQLQATLSPASSGSFCRLQKITISK